MRARRPSSQKVSRRRTASRGRANPFSPADVALLGANVAAVGGIAYSFALDKKSKVLDRAVLRETDRAGILRDTHLDRGPEGRKYVSTPDLKALADPHVYTRAWDARKRELLEQLRTGDYEIRRTGEHQWYFTRPGEARGVHGPATAHGAHGAHGLPSGAQYPGLPAPSIYTDDLHGAHGTHGAREHAAVRSNPRTTTGSRFDALVQEFERRGVRSPRGLAASIGRRKYGAKRFAAMGAAGRARTNPTLGGINYSVKVPGEAPTAMRLLMEQAPPVTMNDSDGNPFVAIGTFHVARQADKYDDPEDVSPDGFVEILSGYVSEGYKLHGYPSGMSMDDDELDLAVERGAQRALRAELKRQGVLPGGASSRRPRPSASSTQPGRKRGK